MPAWALAIGQWLLRLIAGAAVAEQQGRTAARHETDAKTIGVQDAQLEIAARGGADRDRVLNRMRDGDL